MSLQGQPEERRVLSRLQFHVSEVLIVLSNWTNVVLSQSTTFFLPHPSRAVEIKGVNHFSEWEGGKYQ